MARAAPRQAAGPREVEEPAVRIVTAPTQIRMSLWAMAAIMAVALAVTELRDQKTPIVRMLIRPRTDRDRFEVPAWFLLKRRVCYIRRRRWWE